MANLQTVKIFPSIGMARLGNSPEFYIGPELPFPAPPPVPPDGKYKDAQCRIRRQAQRFRLFGFFDDGTNRELTAADGTVQWTVHLANAKPQPAEGITIDPGSRTLSGPNDSATFANGTYQGVEVPLGEAHTDADARLIVVGGFGASASPSGAPIVTFEDNHGWYDDVSDGPVNATITVGGHLFQAAGAWAICPPPHYAPTVQSVISLYDTMRQTAIDDGLLAAPGQPSFVNDIYPILTRALNARRVAAAAFGPGDHDTVSSVIPPVAGTSQDAARAAIFAKLANPAGGGGDMPLLFSGPDTSTLRQFQYEQVRRWSLAPGDFVNDWPPVAPTTVTPDGLTRAALEAAVGAAFFPGIEATKTVRTFHYVEPFRFDQSTLQPGAVTTGMSRPWQSDFNACGGGTSPDMASWWPAARPDSVFPEATPAAPADWTRAIVSSPTDMVANWHRLGFILDDGSGNLVEKERHVVCQDCFVITDRSTVGKDEVDAMLVQQQPAVIDQAFYVVVEGFKPADLGITTPAPTPAQLQALAPSIALSPTVTGLSVRPSKLLVEDPSLPPQPQRFTFVYQLVFASSAGFTVEVRPVTLTASIAGVSSSGVIVLTLQPNPFEVDGPISWLSTDLRVVQIRPNGSLPGLPAVRMGSTPAEASTFIKAVIAGFNGLPAVNHPFDLISVDQQSSRLELSEKVNGTPVFNFAVCRVRYLAKVLDAQAVRVFFRLFQTAATGTNYDIASTYRRGGQPGVTIPLLGVQGGELVTIPCFAEPRVDTSTVPMNMQTDPANVQTIAHDASGAEVHAYFGCWLDINQPSQSRFPIQPSPPDGPFAGGTRTIQELIRGLHQCLVAEIAFDPDPIPQGISPAASDKLAQRNLAIVQSSNPGNPASHRIQHTFTMEHSDPAAAPDGRLDELMIDWGDVPAGSTATLYLPGLRAAEILDAAGRLFDLQTLRRLDDHTLTVRAGGGVTYVPIPPGSDLAPPGLLSVDLPAGLKAGQAFTIVVRQVTSRRVVVAPPPPPIGIASSVREGETTVVERQTIGAFQITVPVRTAEEMLEAEERALSVLRWIQRAIPIENRWALVFRRYVHEIANRVAGLGGEPDEIGPSPSGDFHHPPHTDDDDEEHEENGDPDKRSY